MKFLWTDDCVVAFDDLKFKSTMAPILIILVHNGKLVISTDASRTGLLDQ